MIFLNFETKVVRGFKGFDEKTGAISFPIYQCATFRHPELNASTGYDYSRTLNPTREELENTVALLENGIKAYAFASGMAAITSVFRFFKPGDHIIVSDDLYGGTYRIFEDIFKIYSIDFSYIDTSDITAIEASIKSNTAGIFIETPSNPMMKVTDLARVSEIARKKGIITIVDNTFLTPFFQKPLDLGIDIVVHSGTKYLSGHNDVIAGFVVHADEKLAEKTAFIQNSEGAILSPFDSWLALRGIKTLAIRMERHQENAMKIAKWLQAHDKVESVNYIGLPEHPGYEVSKRQTTGFGGMISFTVKDSSIIENILKNVKLIYFAESLGGVESLITYPLVQTHSSIPTQMLDRIGVNDRLLRLSVGIESCSDLIEDLEQALR